MHVCCVIAINMSERVFTKASLTQVYRRRYESRRLPKPKLHYENKQELSYRRQIARKLCTQYVQGIYRSNYRHLEI